MSEELENVGGESTAPETTVSEIEQRALELGWRPRDEFAGTDDEFVDAKEFVRRQPLFDRIHAQNQEIKAVRKSVELLKDHLSAVREAEYKRALAALKAERKQALSDGDGDRFEALDDEIKSVETQVQEIKAAAAAEPQVQAEHPEFSNWKQRNRWYETTGYMRQFADDYGTSLARQGVAPADVLKKVEEAVRKEFPQKFSNPNKANAPAVNSGNGASKQSSDNFEASLSPQEKRIMETIVRSGVKKADYIAQLKQIKGIK